MSSQGVSPALVISKQVLEEFASVPSTNADYSNHTFRSAHGHIFRRNRNDINTMGQMQHRFHVGSSGEPKESVCALKTTGCHKSTGNGETWQGTVNLGIWSGTRSALLFNQALRDPAEGKAVPRANPSYCGIYWL